MLLLRLLQLRHLHCSLRIEPSRLELLCSSLQAKLALLTCQLAREPCLLSLELCRLLAQPCLLCGNVYRPLSRLLCKPCGL